MSRKPFSINVSTTTFMYGIVVVSSADIPKMSGWCSSSAARNLSTSVLMPEVDDFEAGTLEHHRRQVLADVVDVALHRADDHLADRFCAGLGQQRPQNGHAGLHRVGRQQHLGDEQDAVAEVDADDPHPLDQRVVEHPVGAPTAVEQNGGAFEDLVGETVVQVVVHLRDEVAVAQRGEVEIVLFTH